jgi:C1A family cysteine protease
MPIEPIRIRRFGWLRDSPDPRDRLFGDGSERILSALRVPPTGSVESEMPAVFDQGDVGSCTANADTAVVEHAAMKAGDHTPLSRMGLYADERIAEGQTPPLYDSGAQVRTGIKIAVSHGIGPETDFPYQDRNVPLKPPAQYYRDAVKHEALTYKRISVSSPGAPMRSAIVQGFPITFGFPVPEAFEDGSWDPATEPLPLPTATTNFIGGHAVVVVGYDFSCQRFPVPVFRIRNSWGLSFGDAGHFWMPHLWFDRAETMASDLWVVMTAK